MGQGAAAGAYGRVSSGLLLGASEIIEPGERLLVEPNVIAAPRRPFQNLVKIKITGQIAEGHFDPATLMEETALGAGLGYGLHKGVPWVNQRFIQGPAQQRAIDAARTTLSTGRQQAPVLPPAPFREAARRLIFGQAAAGGLPGQN
jgi:hypothetical protein